MLRPIQFPILAWAWQNLFQIWNNGERNEFDKFVGRNELVFDILAHIFVTYTKLSICRIVFKKVWAKREHLT